MQGWVVADVSGRSYLVRAGTGVVTAVVPVGLPAPDGTHARYRVEIDVDRPKGSARAIRYSVSALVAADDPLCLAAVMASDDGRPMVWAVEWRRHDWVPGHVRITSLDLAREAEARLVSLDPVLTTKAVEAVEAVQQERPS